MEGCADIRGGFGPDPSTMSFDDAPDVGQPDAGALELFLPVQSMEHAKQLAGVAHVEPDAVVADGKRPGIVAGLRADGDHGRRLPPGIFNRVAEQVLPDE